MEVMEAKMGDLMKTRTVTKNRDERNDLGLGGGGNGGRGESGGRNVRNVRNYIENKVT